MLGVVMLKVIVMLTVVAPFFNLPSNVKEDFVFLDVALPSAGLATSDDLKF